jgi:hypothetical protein
MVVPARVPHQPESARAGSEKSLQIIFPMEDYLQGLGRGEGGGGSAFMQRQGIMNEIRCYGPSG